MSRNTTIYVRLVNEDVDVWRPAQAEHLHDGVYRLLPCQYDQEIEQWEFEPGQTVFCEHIQGRAGTIFAATKRLDMDG